MARRLSRDRFVVKPSLVLSLTGLVCPGRKVETNGLGTRRRVVGVAQVIGWAGIASAD